MWAVEAKTFGDDPNFFYTYGLTYDAARKLHRDMVNSGEWPYVRSWDADAELEEKESQRRIDEYFQSREDGIGEGQPNE